MTTVIRRRKVEEKLYSGTARHDNGTITIIKETRVTRENSLTEKKKRVPVLRSNVVELMKRYEKLSYNDDYEYHKRGSIGVYYLDAKRIRRYKVNFTSGTEALQVLGIETTSKRNVIRDRYQTICLITRPELCNYTRIELDGKTSSCRVFSKGHVVKASAARRLDVVEEKTKLVHVGIDNESKLDQYRYSTPQRFVIRDYCVYEHKGRYIKAGNTWASQLTKLTSDL